MQVSSAYSAPRACDEWNAVYVSQPDEDGVRVYAEFGKAEGSNPMPFTFTGVGKSGAKLWRHRTKAWCFLGSGGCFVGLMTQGLVGRQNPEFEQQLRITFVRSSKTDTKATPDILVLSGLKAAFLDAARAGGEYSVALESFSDAPAPEDILPPEAYYFEKKKKN